VTLRLQRGRGRKVWWCLGQNAVTSRAELLATHHGAITWGSHHVSQNVFPCVFQIFPNESLNDPKLGPVNCGANLQRVGCWRASPTHLLP
jgi:hypothetical protein